MILTGLGILAFFYLVYFGKMLLQKRKGIQTDQIAKGTKKDFVFYVELVLKCATYAAPVVEVISIFAVQDYLPMPVVVLGAVLGILGDLVFVTAVITMRDSWRAGIAKEEKTTMVTGGIYKYSRNPAFLGFDLVYVGILLMFFNWFLFGFTLFAMLMLHVQILQEEKHLAKVFGAEYLSYKKRVNRYFGWKSWQINDAAMQRISEAPVATKQEEVPTKPVETEMVQAPTEAATTVSNVEFTVNEMLKMQETLQKKYNDRWEPIGPEAGRHKLLWMIGELGEVIDVVKKNGGQKACEDTGIRKELVEELADVLMYYNDVLLCYGISVEELKQVYTEKFQKNMERW